MAQQSYPRLNYRFNVEIKGLIEAGFQEVSIPDISQEPVEYREGWDKLNFPRKLAGLAKVGTFTLKWGLTNSRMLYDWRAAVAARSMPQDFRKTVTISLLDDMGDKDVAIWVLTNAWPSKYEAPSLNATGNEVAIETLELQCETVQRTL